MKICITGNDASGKATQAKILAERLSATLFAFPDYSTPTGRLIQSHLQEGWHVAREGVKDTTLDNYTYYPKDDNALVLQSLMNTNRIERMAELQAAAERGHVILDRYDVDAIVYGIRDGLDPIWLEKINAQLPVKPDLYILLDVPVEEGFRRRPQRRDRYERDVKRMEDVRVAYLRLFAEQQSAKLSRTREMVFGRGLFEPGPTWRIVDGTGTIEQVAERVREAVGL